MNTLSKLKAIKAIKSYYSEDKDPDEPKESLVAGLCAILRRNEIGLNEKQVKWVKERLRVELICRGFGYTNSATRQTIGHQGLQNNYVWKPYMRRPRIEWLNSLIKELEKDVQFIIVSDEKPAKNFKGEIIGTTPKRALFWSKDVGRHRAYRASFELPENQALSMVMFKFDDKKEAQELCKGINKAYNDDFKLEAILK